MAKHRHKYMIGFASIVLFCCTLFAFDYMQSRGVIYIQNKSNDPLTQVYIVYQSTGKTYPLPNIPAKSSYGYPIDYINHNEQSAYLHYQKLGKNYSVLASDYHAVYQKKPYKVVIQ